MKFLFLISMKQISFQFLMVIILFTASCSKSKSCDDPVDCLPPITQMGANTAGCLVNDKAFLPAGQGINTGSVLKAQYDFTDDSESVFGLSIMDLTSGENKMMLIEIRNKELIEGGIYELERSSSKSLGYYFDSYQEFVTDNDHRGELIISKIDTEKHIVSGTFWFDAVNTEGEIVKIRNGRFDVLYY